MTQPRYNVQIRRDLSFVLLIFALMAPLSGVAQAHPSADGAQRKVRKAPPSAPVEPEPVFEMTLVPPPPPPLTPGQMPPNPPTVTYEDGLLSISAENSTLFDILTAVKASTGTTMDIPASAGADRVWITLGPGPARAILASLLSGTSLDYVIQASDADQAQIQSVLLSPRIKGPKGADSGVASGQSFSSRYRQLRNRPNFGTPDSSDTDSASPDTSGTADPNTASNAATTSAQPTATADAQPAAADTAPTNPTTPALSARLPLAVTEADAHPTPIANPEQAIPQMQNLFEMRRQLQEQQNAQQKAAATR